eukprot:scaffold26604_cov116-Isochrysis_galbana.AAC.3
MYFRLQPPRSLGLDFPPLSSLRALSPLHRRHRRALRLPPPPQPPLLLRADGNWSATNRSSGGPQPGSPGGTAIGCGGRRQAGGGADDRCPFGRFARDGFVDPQRRAAATCRLHPPPPAQRCAVRLSERGEHTARRHTAAREETHRKTPHSRRGGASRTRLLRRRQPPSREGKGRWRHSPPSHPQPRRKRCAVGRQDCSLADWQHGSLPRCPPLKAPPHMQPWRKRCFQVLLAALLLRASDVEAAPRFSEHEERNRVQAAILDRGAATT